MPRRLIAVALICVGLTGLAAAALTNLHWLTTLLAPLAADGRVDALSLGEALMLRSVALATSLALVLSGIYLTALSRAMSHSRRRLNVRLRALAPRRISATLTQLSADHGCTYVILLLALLLGGTAVRLAHLAQPVHDDEAGAYLNWSAEPLYVTFTKYGAPGNHVLHTALVALSTRAFGDDPWAVRLPALLTGILCLPATFRLVRRLCGPWPALFALALLSASHAAIEYSANARGYSLATLLGLWQTAAVLRAIDKPRWTNWRAVILPTALALYTLPTMIYLAAALALYALIANRSKLALRLVAAFSLAGILTAALYAPFLLIGGAAALTHNEFYRPLPLTDWFAAIPARIVQTLELSSAGLGDSTLVLVLAAIGLVASRRLPHAPPPLWLTLFLAPLAIAFVQRLLPFARTLLYLQPFCYALCAIGLSFLMIRRPPRSTRILPSRYTGTLSLRHSVTSSLRHFFPIPLSAFRNPHLFRLSLPAHSFLLTACCAAFVPLIASFTHLRVGFLSRSGFPDAAAVSQYLARSWPDDVPVFVVKPAVRPLLYHLRREAGNLHPVHEQPPAADLALWVRSADAQPTPAYRESLDRLCADFAVGPVLRRFGSAEVVLLRSRAADSTPRLIARTDRPEDRP